MPNPIQLLREQQATNRFNYAQAEQARRTETESNLSGRVLGCNAETGRTMVQLDSGGIVPCRSITSGALKAGASAIVTMNGSTAWVDGMPG